MKTRISNLQIVLLTGNFIFAATLVTTPQALIDLSMQNTWLVPTLIFLFIFIFIQLVFWGFKKIKNYDKLWESKHFLAKGTAFLVLLLLVHILVRDLRMITAFTSHVLLPLTPKFVITMLFIFTIMYIAWAGMEVIARFTELYFLYLIVVILFIPWSLTTQIEFARFEPLLGLQYIPSVLQSTYVGFAWGGELIALIIIITMVKPIKDAKRSILIGAGLGMFLLTILILCQISVFGAEIVRFAIFPSYQLVQQVRITEFLDRLDLVLVAFYYPAIFAKMAFSLYGIQRCFEIIFNKESKLILIPIGLLMGILSIAMFNNLVENYDFGIFTWASLGLILEIMIGMMFILQIRKTRKREEAK